MQHTTSTAVQGTPST
ncbi:hypothetical protein LINPERHAP1_LOCUS18434 [Linum perenne]